MSVIYSINQFLWSYPLLILLFGTHIYFTIRLKGIQRHVLRGIRLSVFPDRSKRTDARTGQPLRRLQKDVQKDASSISTSSQTNSPFAALMTTLAATIGTGNIIGMSTAVALGGPGAVFWCWMTGVLGMATSYSECYLAHHFRNRQPDGSYHGGTMYLFGTILKKRWIAMLYAGAVVAASFLIGCAAQSNSIALTSASAFHVSPILCGLVCAFLLAIVLLGGGRLIPKVCSLLVPVMSIFYIISCILLLLMTKNYIQPALKLILSSAFAKESLTGGILGGGITATLRYGISRGLFTNEAGMGTAGITAATVDTPSSTQQALISMTGVFWDTVVMCGITGLLIVSNFLKHPSSILSYGAGELTLAAFENLPYGEQLLSISLILFALSTMIGWFFLGERALIFLTGNAQVNMLYKCIYLIVVFGGCILSLNLVWELSDFVNLFLLVPNLFILFRLRKEIHPPE